MECSCTISCDAGDCADFYKQKRVSAKRIYKCCECGEKISIGQKHEYYFLAQDGDTWRYRTCQDCVEMRGVFFNGWMFTSIWSVLRDSIMDGEIEATEKCLSRLNPKNLEKVCAIVEEMWERMED